MKPKWYEYIPLYGMIKYLDRVFNSIETIVTINTNVILGMYFYHILTFSIILIILFV